jgi:hypothetical protein
MDQSVIEKKESLVGKAGEPEVKPNFKDGLLVCDSAQVLEPI